MRTTADLRKQLRLVADMGYEIDLLDDLDHLLALLREVSKLGVEESDARMDWFNLQMDKDLWREIQEVLR